MRTEEELRRYESLGPDWQREESRINLYLLLCAISCTLDDYLAYRPRRLKSIGLAFPRLRSLALTADALINIPYTLRTFRDRRLAASWRPEVNRCVDRICEVLVSGGEPGEELWVRFAGDLQTLSAVRLPEVLLRWRMRIPEGYRCQDMAHHDVLAMARRFARSEAAKYGPVLIVGPRTAGAYFAPLVQACLRAEGMAVAGWTTFRPKLGASRREQRRFRGLMSTATRMAVVDDHPNTGGTFTRTTALVKRLGVPADKITLLAPEHPAQPDWQQATRPIEAVTLPASEFHKQKLLDDPAAITAILRQLYAERGYQDVSIQPGEGVDAANARLWSHYADGFQVRLKRLFEVKLLRPGQAPQIQRVLAKSVGWGWLGYHGYVAGRRLAGYVPPVVGLRDGLLFTEWLGSTAAEGNASKRWSIVSRLPLYVAERTRRLKIEADPCSRADSCRWTGRDTLAQILRRVYGPVIGRLKTGAVRTELERYASPLPTMLDGRIGAEEWITDGSGTYKSDFEHHNFGGAELDLVDPAYDLACAAFEFDLSEDEERGVLRTYARQSGDQTASDRLLLHKLLCGYLAMKTAAYRIARTSSRERQAEWNRRYLSGRDFLIRQMNRHNAKSLEGLGRAVWSSRLFFLDLDGVLDWDFFGFPHTTPSGVRALQLLRTNGYSVVLNTGRSVEHVRRYCQDYGLPGGVAEYGSVFVDAVHGVEKPLVDAEGQEQLQRCRELLEKIPGVFTDPAYEWSVRAYRYRGQSVLGLEKAEIEKLLSAAQLDKLKLIGGHGDSYVVQKGLDKGTGLMAVKEYVGGVEEPTSAMGDSIHDLEMLQQAGIAYMPSNRSRALRVLDGDPKCQVMRQPLQKGLLEAVERMIAGAGPAPKQAAGSVEHVVDSLLRVAERTPVAQVLSILAILQL
jgi:hydroxymethylpyrimidine pyrophosphatase-like HAD family hydrolase